MKKERCMRETVLGICALCVFAAFFDQLVQDRSFVRAMRMVLGLEIFHAAFRLFGVLISKII